MPNVMQVIRSKTSRGKGIEKDPCRWVTQYHTLDGKLLAEHDPFTDGERPEGEEWG